MDWKIGDKVHFVTRDFCVDQGHVQEIHEEYFEIKEKYGSIGRRSEDMFRTKKEAMKEADRRIEALKDEYRKKINSKEDLLNFIFRNCGSFEEYADDIANEVGREKVWEMFGVKIKE